VSGNPFINFAEKQFTENQNMVLAADEIYEEQGIKKQPNSVGNTDLRLFFYIIDSR